MRTYREAKGMAKQLRARLAERKLDLSHSDCLELVADQFGYRDWNMMAARIALAERRSADGAAGIRMRGVVPIVRMLSRDKAREFYLDFLGFRLDWNDESAWSDDAPLYTQLSRGKAVLHLSEHHGDGTPGSVAWVSMKGLDAFHRELLDRNYPNMRPGIQQLAPWVRFMEVLDPFGNRLRFGEMADREIRDDDTE